ncbi:radical SAM protein [Fervidicella metallireducens AeB]|uniref:Radical SAM protein n=1 Tax=Fervidicella metallireducens AeB TaxID=1403537 RepID=A0A017RWP1_9CLOT|nr:spore photoproduct lyase [Fervidicella metallireducens]EYE89067.1 radical SAM protein [Fervidicella metallireducens AeB]
MFLPEQVYFEPGSLEYPLGKDLLEKFKALNIPIFYLSSHNKINSKTENPSEYYSHAKKSIVVGVKKSMKLEPCKPSADYQFSLVTGCPGSCEYCYLQTNQSLKPFTRIYVNIEEILENVQKYIDINSPNITSFEIGSTCDPISVEHFTGSVRKTIDFFGKQKYGRLRLVTKFSAIDSLLDALHNKNTKIRFSLNSKYVIQNFEHNTDSLEERISASGKIYSAGYPLGFIIAPIMYYDGWKEQYIELLESLKSKIINPDDANLSFELIQYRFTTKAKKVIIERFPNTKLDMDEANRIKKWGPYGVYKYVYSKETAFEIKNFFTENINRYFPNANIEYFT